MRQLSMTQVKQW